MEVRPASPHYAKGAKRRVGSVLVLQVFDTLGVYQLENWGKTQAISANSYSHRNLKRLCHKHTSEPESWFFLFIAGCGCINKCVLWGQ